MSRGRIGDAFFTALTAVGLALAIFGLALDALPGTSPGFNLPQILAVASGLLLAGLSFALRRESLRKRRLAAWRRRALPTVFMVLATLMLLEIALTVAGMSTYFPHRIPEAYYSGEPFIICDEAGCHINPAATSDKEACAKRFEMRGSCLVNRQGFHDTQDFAASDDLREHFRALALGDSFTFGMSADMGQSFIERIEAEHPDIVLWNMGMFGTGTRQAVESFSVYGPMLRPHLTIYGFYMNDFRDNVVPTRGYRTGDGLDDEALFRWEDHWGNEVWLDLPTTWYYREQRQNPPFSELQRLTGMTRLGTLLLRLIDVLAESVYAGLREGRENDATRMYLRQLRDAVASQDSALLVLLIPHRNDVAEPGPRYQTAIRYLRELDIPYMDPLELFDVSADYAPRPDVHWNTVGHQKIGALLSECLASFMRGGALRDCEHVAAD